MNYGDVIFDSVMPGSEDIPVVPGLDDVTGKSCKAFIGDGLKMEGRECSCLDEAIRYILDTAIGMGCSTNLSGRYTLEYGESSARVDFGDDFIYGEIDFH